LYATMPTINLKNGEVVECTITNRDIAPSLKLIKTVENSYGGNAVPADFVQVVTLLRRHRQIKIMYYLKRSLMDMSLRILFVRVM